MIVRPEAVKFATLTSTCSPRSMGASGVAVMRTVRVLPWASIIWLAMVRCQISS
ncbi:Uncharacterised protein [Mycobacteroides abscessus subsp. abscessus]|nr:Uncharacterised protein [Mycobacteroides abscessus subsp. abscessus]